MLKACDFLALRFSYFLAKVSRFETSLEHIFLIGHSEQGGQNMQSNHFCGANPKFIISKSNQLELVLRSDADPNGDAEKTFQLKVEKTKGFVYFNKNL